MCVCEREKKKKNLKRKSIRHEGLLDLGVGKWGERVWVCWCWVFLCVCVCERERKKKEKKKKENIFGMKVYLIWELGSGGRECVCDGAGMS